MNNVLELKDEEIRVRELLERALTSVKEAMSSRLWSYTREYDLGKLDVAKSILLSAIDELKALELSK